MLFVSTDEKPENKRQVTAKDKISLTAGRAYYVEAIHREKGGKDYFSVGWRLPDGNEENPIPGSRLSLRDRPIPPHETGFVTLTPVRVEASDGTQLRILDDGAVLADGATKENEVYRLVFETQMPTITAFQLQAVPHESLPGGGPGVGLGGSFRLAEFQVAVGSTDGDTAAPIGQISRRIEPGGQRHRRGSADRREPGDRLELPARRAAGLPDVPAGRTDPHVRHGGAERDAAQPREPRLLPAVGDVDARAAAAGQSRRKPNRQSGPQRLVHACSSTWAAARGRIRPAIRGWPRRILTARRSGTRAAKRSRAMRSNIPCTARPCEN